MKVLVVEDNVSSRILLTKIISKDGYEVTAVNDGEKAMNALQEQNFDAVVTDWMMPNLDGLELTEKIRKMVKPSPVIVMITALASPEARSKALFAGADEYIAKPFHNKEVLDRLRNCLNRREVHYISKVEENARKYVPEFIGVGVAASTGGPSALMSVFPKIASTKRAAFFTVLHGPAWMLRSFTERLQQMVTMPVRLAVDGMPYSAGEIYFAPGDMHMVVDQESQVLRLLDTPPENFVRPAADPLFRSIAQVFGKKSMAVVLTGMGHDGSIGSGYISAAGGLVIAQDPQTATLSSMPQTLVDLRIAKVVSPLDQIGGTISDHILRAK